MIVLLCLSVASLIFGTISAGYIHNEDKKNFSVKNVDYLENYRRINVDIFDIGPKKTEFYNPNYGYEPYWPGGDWVFDRYDTTTEKRIGSMCGQDCPEMYILFSFVCGRNKNFKHKTFDNYCELINEDCTGREKWMIAYRGKCQDELKTFPTKHDQIATRAMEYISSIQIASSTIRLFQ